MKPFEQKKIAPPPPRWLTAEEVTRLLEACESEGFRDFVHGALLTGCRRGELAGLRVKDYNPAVGMVEVPASIAKTGKARGVPLTDEGRDLFDRLTAAGRAPRRFSPNRTGSRGAATTTTARSAPSTPPRSRRPTSTRCGTRSSPT